MLLVVIPGAPFGSRPNAPFVTYGQVRPRSPPILARRPNAPFGRRVPPLAAAPSPRRTWPVDRWGPDVT